MKTNKIFSLAVAMTVALSANAQQTSDNVKSEAASSNTETLKKFTHEAAFYVQDGWGLGYQLRKPISKIGNWNVFGLLYWSGFNSPADAGMLNFKLIGGNVQYNFNNWLGLYTDINLGYALQYYKMPNSTETSHYFLQEMGAGFLLFKKVSVGLSCTLYNYKNAELWGKVAFLF